MSAIEEAAKFLDPEAFMFGGKPAAREKAIETAMRLALIFSTPPNSPSVIVDPLTSILSEKNR